jgi:hypothetical protein
LVGCLPNGPVCGSADLMVEHVPMSTGLNQGVMGLPGLVEACRKDRSVLVWT